MGDGVHPDGGVIVDLGIMVDQLPGHDGNIPGRGHMGL